MSLNFLDLKAKHQPKEFTLNIYQTDHDKFYRFVEFINRGKSSEDAIALEDVFEELIKATDQVEGFSDYLAMNKGTKRARKSKPAEE